MTHVGEEVGLGQVQGSQLGGPGPFLLVRPLLADRAGDLRGDQLEERAVVVGERQASARAQHQHPGQVVGRVDRQHHRLVGGIGRDPAEQVGGGHHRAVTGRGQVHQPVGRIDRYGTGTADPGQSQTSFAVPQVEQPERHVGPMPVKHRRRDRAEFLAAGRIGEFRAELGQRA
ncbi:hypothetical protein [Micromonospora lutea]|uniref:Uncharacterized protein n=1 Tax=Micromonospora lutea TaxID=419825 RepID=A0ABQ4IQG9_9ACTN|nr:hypothetical protein [Micromonospora lutea]GIJ20174.1 hypothetical protein Vlu01_07980 [Micromonospora lutea]